LLKPRYISTFGTTKNKNVIYNLAIRIYRLGVSLASYRNDKAKKWIEGRKNWQNKLKEKISPQDNVMWFHCASLGEFEQGRPVIEELIKDYHNWKVLITFFSPSGYEVRKNYDKADCIMYLPLDTKKNAKEFIELANPKLAFFVKYEFWKNYLSILQSRQVPLYLVSGVFRDNHFFFKWYGKSMLKKLNAFTHFFVQNKESEDLLRLHAFGNVTLTGDTRFDRVVSTTQNFKRFPEVEKFICGKPVIICGSSWETEETIVAEYIRKNTEDVKIIIAPHEVHASKIEKLQKLLPVKSLLYTEIDDNQQENFDVLIINTIGILSSLYQYGSIAFVGGAFGKGLHNILEAAAFGMPILFGPNIKNFLEFFNVWPKKYWHSKGGSL
jgi:3-deoxy-D-manno-octulosonic-acid transferase